MKKSIKKITQFVFTFVALLILVLGIKGTEVSAEEVKTTSVNPYKMDLSYGTQENGARNYPGTDEIHDILQATPSANTVYIEITTRRKGDGWIKIFAEDPCVIDPSAGKTTNCKKLEKIPVKASRTYRIECPVSTGGSLIDFYIDYHIHEYDRESTITSIGTIEGHKLKKQCSCGKWSDEDETEAHTWKKSYTVAPTCTEKGYTISTCKGCKEQKKEYNTNKIQHNYSSYAQLNSSQHKIKCSRCSDYIVENHSFVRSGSNNVCSKCGYSYDTSGISSSDDSFNSAAPPKKFYVTKFDSKKVNITIVPSSLNYLDETVDYEVYANGKKVKTFSNYRGYDAIIFTYKAKGAAKKKYQVKVVQKADNSVAVSATLKPKTNKPKKVKYSFTKRASAYSVMANTWRPSSITKKGNKITVKGFFVNNHILKLSSIKCRILVQYVNIDSRRTTIKSKVINSGSMRAHSIKNTSFSFSTKKLMDFQNEGRLHVDYFITGWRY